MEQPLRSRAEGHLRGPERNHRSLIERAVPLARQALQLDPRSPWALLALAAVEVGSGRPAEALGFAKQALFLAPSNSQAQAVVGIMELQLGRLEEGTRSLDLAIRLDPVAVGYTWTLLGMAYAGAGDFERAVPLWQRVVASNSDAIPDRMLLASHYLAAGRPAEAARLIQEIRAINPNYDVAMASHWLQRAGAPPETIEQTTQALHAAGLP